MNLSILYNKPLFAFSVMSLICTATSLKAMCNKDEEKKSTSVRFSVIGDYGTESKGAQNVSTLLKSWDPDFIITTGDNNYPKGEAETIDKNIGAFYSQYIYPYRGEYDQSSVTHNHFWPCLGNHDFGKNGDARPYFDYFPALKNQFYYDFVEGNVHFFSVCSDRKCPDGISSDSRQLCWLKKKVQESQQTWKIVYYHHPTYSSRVRSPGGGKWPPENLEKIAREKLIFLFLNGVCLLS